MKRREIIRQVRGERAVDGAGVPEKTAVLFGPGDGICVGAPPDSALRFLFFSAKPLREPVAWGGPIVMNTQAELLQAFRELREGTFIRRP